MNINKYITINNTNIEYRTPNIYSIYIYITNNIKVLQKDLKKLSRDLNNKKGFPKITKPDYQERTYISKNTRDIQDIYNEIEEILKTIRELREQLDKLFKTKKELEDAIYYASSLNQKDLEMKVFIGYYVEKKSLKELKNEIIKVDYYGYNKRYTYDHIRRIHSQIVKKIKKLD